MKIAPNISGVALDAYAIEVIVFWLAGGKNSTSSTNAIAHLEVAIIPLMTWQTMITASDLVNIVTVTISKCMTMHTITMTLRPCKSLIRGKIADEVVYPMKYMEPINPILAGGMHSRPSCSAQLRKLS